jgi:hypothetical protein
MYAIEPNGDEPSNTKTTFTCTGFALEVIFLAP